MRKYIWVILSLFPIGVFAGSFGDFQLDAYTVGLWYFEGDATDESGYGNNGSITGASSTNFGKFGQAYTYDGSGDYITVERTGHPEIDPAEMTIEVWVKIDTVDNNSNSKILCRNAGTTNECTYGIRVRDGVSNDEIACMSYTGTKTEDYFSPPIWDTGWHYIACTFSSSDGGTLTGYYDGVQMTQSTSLGSLSYRFVYTSDDVYVGSQERNLYVLSDGRIDSVRISNVARSAEEIRAYYRQSQGVVIE